MKNLTITTKGFVGICLGLIILDLFIKIFINKNYEQGQFNQILGGLFTIGNVKTVSMALGFDISHKIMIAIKVIFQLAIVLLFFRVQRLNIKKLYKVSVSLIVFGWLGNYLDKFILMSGDSNYQHLDYFRIIGFRPFLNISTVMTSIGWILLLIAIVIGFKDIKMIFGKAKQ